MITKSYMRDGHERVWGTVKNGIAGALLKGTAVCYDYGSVKDGSVILPTTLGLGFFAGVMWDDAGTSGLNTDVARVLAFGYHPGVYMAGTTVHPGAMMYPVNAKSNVALGVTINDANSTALDNAYKGAGCVVAATTACLKATSTFGNTEEAFVRAL